MSFLFNEPVEPSETTRLRAALERSEAKRAKLRTALEGVLLGPRSHSRRREGAAVNDWGVWIGIGAVIFGLVAGGFCLGIRYAINAVKSEREP